MERLFIGPPVVNNSTVVEFKRTGGKSKAKFEVRVCFVDPLTGNDKKTKTFRSRGDKLRFKHTFKSMASTVPMILLKSKRPKPLQNTKYKIRVYQGGGTVSATSGKGKSSAKKPKARRASSKSRKRKGSSKSRKRKGSSKSRKSKRSRSKR